MNTSDTNNLESVVRIKPASFGSISTGTLRTEDLLEAFGSELERLVFANGAYFSQPENFGERDRLNSIIGEWQDLYDDDGETLKDFDDAEMFLHETLMDALCEFAPQYGYFGNHPGDGADFGFWVDVDDVKEQVEFVSSRSQEYPADAFQGEWLHINDHGNCTLYVRANGQDREIWATV